MTTALLFPTFGPMELVLILIIVVVLFGAGRLGDVGKSLGEGITSFKKALGDGEKSAPAEEAAGDSKPPAKAD